MTGDAIRRQIEESIAVKREMLDTQLAVIQRMSALCIERAKAGATLYLMGNGGSFSDALHIVGEFVGRFAYDRPAMRAVALGANPASTTAIGNDYGYESIFAREVDALVRAGDVVIGLSTSGKSPNVVAALNIARSKQAHTLGFTGKHRDTALTQACELTLHVPATSSWRIQECHICVGHILAAAVEEALYPRSTP